MNSERSQPSCAADACGDLEADIDMLRATFVKSGIGKPPLGWVGVHAFEEKYDIMLPEPYRTFVAEFADGCDEGPPHYGLLPLNQRHYYSFRHSDGDDDDAQHPAARFTPSAPFPLTEAWAWEDDSPTEDEEYLEDVQCAVFNHGAINLGTDGCAIDWYLIVTGPHRGHIWNICGEGAAPFGQLFGDGTASKPGFGGWVQYWSSGEMEANKPREL